MAKKIYYYLAGILLLCTAAQAFAADRVLVTSASSIERRDVVYGQPNSTVSWLAITDNQGYPSAVPDPYAAGYRYYGPTIHGTETITGSVLDFNAISSELSIAINSGDTWPSLADRFAKTYGQSGTKAISTYTGGATSTFTYFNSCFGVTKVQGMNVTSVQAYTDLTTCAKTQQTSTPATCDIVGPNTIAHGTINAAEVNGYSTTIDASVTCSAAATIGFRILNQSINVGNGITSQLKVNGSATPTTISVEKSTPKAITISSTLQATNPTAGTISGSSTIIVDIQ